MTHADVLDCLSANRRNQFFRVLGDDGESYKGHRITVGDAQNFLKIEEMEEDLYDDPVDCYKCGGDAYNCHHMDDYWKEKELALKEWHI